MSKEEETEIKMKNKNLFDWVQKVEKVTELEQGEDRDYKWLEEEIKNEQMIQRMKVNKIELSLEKGSRF